MCIVYHFVYEINKINKYTYTFNNLIISLIILFYYILHISAQPIPSPLVVPSTSHNHNDKIFRSPLPTKVQNGGSSSHPVVLGYTLHPKRVYYAKHFGVKGL